MKAYEALGAVLHSLGVTTVFGVLGDGNLRFAVAARAAGIGYLAARHEASAVAMADAYARARGQVGVATVTTGPGVTNAVTALMEAVRSQTPVVLLTGAASTSMEDYPQLMDQEAMAKSLGVGVVRFRSSRYLPTDLASALRRAARERRPIMFSVPVDVQEDEVGDCPRAVPPASPGVVVPDRPTIEQVAGLIRASNRPVILAGWGAWLAGAGEALRRLGERTGAVLTTTALTKGFWAGERASVGVSGGFASEEAATILGRADLVLAFGASLNRWTTRGGRMFPDAVVVQVDTSVAAFEHYLRGVVPVVGDAGATAELLLECLGDLPAASTFAHEIDDERFTTARNGDPFTDASTETTIDPRTLTVHLREHLPPNAVVVQDSGAFVGFPGSYYEPARPGGYLFVQGFQTMGLGLALGVGVAAADPDALPVTLVGDGGLLMSLGELETIIRQGTPHLVVVYNDSAYGAEVHIGGHHGFDTDIVRFPDTDFAATARALGGEGFVVRGVADLEPLSTWLEDPRGLLLLDCRTEAHIASPFLGEVFKPALDAPRAQPVR
ncbi:thiamine pyrophosphate-binding protein [Klenkia sp. LSe6-5]|uniref:Thiamine pyrophosphate-binding protein n=1 Tax=Klenkia sesuvii TaxID=3103137 RepID=A0ABU8DYF0_9ACTN